MGKKIRLKNILCIIGTALYLTGCTSADIDGAKDIPVKAPSQAATSDIQPTFEEDASLASSGEEKEVVLDETKRPKHPYGAGVFSWDHLADEEDINCLIQNNITEIYQYLKPEYTDEEIVGFLERMADKGIDVYILDGEPTWSYLENFRYMETVVDRIAYINRYVSRRQRIVGVVYDIEPYVLDKWHSTPEQIMDEYIANIEAVSKKIDERDYNIEMCVCVPYSFDLMGYEDHLHSLIGNSDQVFVLNYNKANEIEDIRTEIDIAKDLHKRIVTVYEIQPGLLSQTIDSVTYYKDGLGAIKTSYEKMLSAYPDTRLGVAYHTLKYLRVLGGE